MTKIFIILRLNFYSFFRSSNFYSRTIPKITLAFLFYFYAIQFSFFYLNEYSYSIFLVEELIYIIKNNFYVIITIDLINRILFRKLPEELKIPFYLLPSKKSLILRISIFKSLLNFFNLNWFFILIPFIIKGSNVQNPFLTSIQLVSITFLIDYLAIFFKIIPKRVRFISIALLLFLVFDNYLNIGIAPVFRYILLLSGNNILILFSLIALIILLDFTIITIFKRNYYKTLFPIEKRFNISLERMYPQSLNLYVLLQTKLIFRNRRTKTMLLTTFLLILIPIYLISFAEIDDIYMIYYLLTCLNGAIGFSIGYHLFSADSDYLQLLHTNKFNFSLYIKSKYWLMNYTSILISTISIPLIATDFNDVILHFSNLLIVIGICNQLLILIGITNAKKIELSQSSFANSQGTDIIQLIFIFILSFIPVFIYFILEILFQQNILLIVLITIGFMPILFNNKIINIYFIKVFKSIKYNKLLRSWE